jgi:hypothetical protein
MKFLVGSCIFVKCASGSMAAYAFAPVPYDQNYRVISEQLAPPFIASHNGVSMTPSDAQMIYRQIQRFQGSLARQSVPKVRNAVPDGTVVRHEICESWHEEVTRVKEVPTRGTMALVFMRELEGKLRCIEPGKLDPACKWLSIVRASVGGSFDPRATRPISISETISYAGLPHEKRVTATIILDPTAKLDSTLSAMFEKFLIQQSRNKASPRLFNSIQVNERKESLAISAGGGLDDVYAFSHCNDHTNSIWIVLYMGPSKTVDYGRALIDAFVNFLSAADFVISDSIVVTSDEEEKMERDSEKQSETDRVQGMESSADFALTLLCES